MKGKKYKGYVLDDFVNELPKELRPGMTIPIDEKAIMPLQDWVNKRINEGYDIMKTLIHGKEEDMEWVDGTPVTGIEHGDYLPKQYGVVATQWSYHSSEENKLKEERMNEDYKLMSIWDVYLFYGGLNERVFEVRRGILAEDAEDAKVKSGLHKLVKESWRGRFLTFTTNHICEVTIEKKKFVPVKQEE